MTPIEKVRDAIIDAAAYCPEHHGPTCAKIKEALSLLEGKVLVPREPNAAMQKALTDLVSIMHGDQHFRDMAAWEAVKGYRAMIQAAEEE